MIRFSVIPVLLILVWVSCERFTMQDHPILRFSDDTIHFDTVFSSIGSVTKELVVYNRSGYTITINRIFLAGGSSSQFRLNIDGEAVIEKSDVQIESNDSMFVFVDVMVDPSDVDSPVSVIDSLIFSCEGIEKNVKLMAWGQNIILLDNAIIGTATWQKGKPYVIYNDLLVDTSETLTIEAGACIYFHRNSTMTVAGTIIVNGTSGAPVLFASDRLEKIYKDIPGQWGGIKLLNCSEGNNINYSIISNTIVGIQLGEPVPGTAKPGLKLFSSILMHSSVSGISAVNSELNAVNCIISHCGSWCIYIASGGDYSFTHCTLTDWWDYGLRLTPSVYIDQAPENSLAATGPVNTMFNNCVITGDKASELNIIAGEKSHDMFYYFGNCLLQLDTIKASFYSKELFQNCIINKDPLFLDFAGYDFRPDSLSPLIDSGDKFFSVIYPSDIRGKSRSEDSGPDIGAYERIAGERKKEQ